MGRTFSALSGLLAALLMACSAGIGAPPTRTCVPKARAQCKGAMLAGRNLAGKNLAGADFRGANLSRANLARANLIGAKLSRAKLVGANLSGTKICSADLRRAGMQRAKIAPTKCPGRSAGTKARGSRGMQAPPLRGSEPGCGDSTQYQWTCVGGDFRGAQMAGARFSGAGVVYADFSGADLSGAQITQSLLLQSNFVGTNLAGARIDGSGINSSNLSGANMTGVAVAGGFLERVNAAGARLSGVTMPGVTGVLWGQPAEMPVGWGRFNTPGSAGAGIPSRDVVVAPETRICPTIFRDAGYGATVDLSGTDLHGASFRYPAQTLKAGEASAIIPACEPTTPGASAPTDVSGSNLVLDGANLAEANLSGLRRVGTEGSLSLVRANLRGANLGDSDLWSTNLSGADLVGANFDGSRFGTDPRYPVIDCTTAILCGNPPTNFTGAVVADASFAGAQWYGWVTCANGNRRLNEAC